MTEIVDTNLRGLKIFEMQIDAFNSVSPSQNLIYPEQQQPQLIAQMQCPTHVKKLQAIPLEQDSKTCKICGRQASLYCKSCKFSLCKQCRICNQKHGLIKIIELNKVKTEYYNNSYACNSCSKSKTVNDDGIWHCNTCNYDLCLECVE